MLGDKGGDRNGAVFEHMAFGAPEIGTNNAGVGFALDATIAFEKWRTETQGPCRTRTGTPVP
jgi:hypothetical protein